MVSSTHKQPLNPFSTRDHGGKASGVTSSACWKLLFTAIGVLLVVLTSTRTSSAGGALLEKESSSSQQQQLQPPPRKSGGVRSQSRIIPQESEARRIPPAVVHAEEEETGMEEEEEERSFRDADHDNDDESADAKIEDPEYLLQKLPTSKLVSETTEKVKLELILQRGEEEVNSHAFGQKREEEETTSLGDDSDQSTVDKKESPDSLKEGVPSAGTKDETSEDVSQDSVRVVTNGLLRRKGRGETDTRKKLDEDEEVKHSESKENPEDVHKLSDHKRLRPIEIGDLSETNRKQKQVDDSAKEATPEETTAKDQKRKQRPIQIDAEDSGPVTTLE